MNVPAQSTQDPLPVGFLLSVVVPVYNEAATLERLLERIRANPIPCEVVVVDDGSTDGTRELLRNRPPWDHLVVCFHDTNRGKGASLRTGFAAAKGDIVLIQDGDLEYDPADYRRLIRPILRDEANVVDGSRFQEGRGHRYSWFYQGNWLLTRVSNVVNVLRRSGVHEVVRRTRRTP